MKADKFKENKYLVAGIMSFPIMIVCSLLVNFNVVDALFLVFMIIAVIRYYIIVKNS